MTRCECAWLDGNERCDFCREQVSALAAPDRLSNGLTNPSPDSPASPANAAPLPALDIQRSVHMVPLYTSDLIPRDVSWGFEAWKGDD